MATIIERPMSAFNDVLPDQQRLQRERVEIIDVDLLTDSDQDHTTIPSQPPRRARFLAQTTTRRRVPRPVQRPRVISETISIDDSDDDIVVEGPTPGSSSQQAPPRRSRLFSPPPQAVPVVMIPPMPSIPRQYADQTSLPMRRRPPSHPSPPVVRPIEHPLPFETAVAGPSSPSRRLHAYRPRMAQASRPSHHVPVMGLGGALISSARARAAQERQDELQARTAAPGFFRRARNSLGRLLTPRLPQEDEEERLAILLTLQEDGGVENFRDQMLRLRMFGTGPRMGFEELQQQPREKEEYKPEYTHPTPPEPSYTFDFAVPSSPPSGSGSFFPPSSKDAPIIVGDDEPEVGPSSSSKQSASSDPPKINALLICACCLDPLVLNGGLSSEDVKDRRVWGLRCGHLIDGKCLAEIGQPAPVQVDVKGKGKANPGRKEPLVLQPYGDMVEEGVRPSNERTSSLPPEDNSIRSRLRSRPHLQTVAQPQSQPSSSYASPSSSSYSLLHPPLQPPLKRKRMARTTASKKRKIEEEFGWRCPVANCGRLHYSVKINGVWGPEKEREVKRNFEDGDHGPRGAIAIFA